MEGLTDFFFPALFFRPSGVCEASQEGASTTGSIEVESDRSFTGVSSTSVSLTLIASSLVAGGGGGGGGGGGDGGGDGGGEGEGEGDEDFLAKALLLRIIGFDSVQAGRSVNSASAE